jgi:hypothetical protein
MNWIITKDHLATGDQKGRVGVGNVSNEHEVALPRVRFRLLDDDDEVYYEGVMDKEGFDDADESQAFAPLDWAMADAGCTEMQYREGNGAWTTL